MSQFQLLLQNDLLEVVLFGQRWRLEDVARHCRGRAGWWCLRRSKLGGSGRWRRVLGLTLRPG